MSKLSALGANVLRLLAANSATVLVNFLTILLIGYLTTDEVLGLFFIVLTYSGTVSLVSAFSLDAAIPVTKSDADVGYLLRAASVLITGVAILSTIAFLVLAATGILQLGDVGIGSILLVLLLSLAMAFAQLLRLTAIRFGDTRAISRATLARGIVYLFGRGGVVLVVWLGLVAPLQAGMLFLAVECLAYLCAAGVTYLSTAGETRTALRASKLDLQATLSKYKKFVLIEWPSNIVDSVTAALPLFFVNSLYGLIGAGIFGFAIRVLATPARQVVISIAEVYHARYSELVRLHDKREIMALFDKSSLNMLWFCIGSLAVMLVALWIAAAAIPDARLQGYAAIMPPLAIWTAASAVININSRLISLLMIQERKLIYDFSALLLMLASFGICAALKLDLVASAYIISLGQTAAYVVYFLVIRQAVHGTAGAGEPRSDS